MGHFISYNYNNFQLIPCGLILNLKPENIKHLINIFFTVPEFEPAFPRLNLVSYH